jgi:GT2 family glycosyltransferase
MLGFQDVNSRYVLFQNNDTVFLNDYLSIICNYMDEHPEVGLRTGQMFNTDNPFHSSFGYFPTLKLKLLGSSILRFFYKKEFPKKKIWYKEPLYVDFVTGASLFVSTEKFNQVGAFDRNYFMYCEEEDLGMKMKLYGYKTAVNPYARFIHHGGKSTNKSIRIEKEYYISLLYYHRKYSKPFAYFFLKLFYFFKAIKKINRGLKYLILSFFILSGANMKYSLKHEQKEF